jgi:hypothetical protein
MKTYATMPLLYVDHTDPLGTFEPGDRIDRNYTPEACAWLVEHDQASHQRPADVTPVYALKVISHRPHPFQPGDRLDDELPAAVVHKLVTSGEATYERPDSG